MEPLISLVIALFVGCLLYWAAVKIMDAFGIGDPIRTLVIVAIVVVLALYLVRSLGYL